MVPTLKAGKREPKAQKGERRKGSKNEGKGSGKREKTGEGEWVSTWIDHSAQHHGLKK